MAQAPILREMAQRKGIERLLDPILSKFKIRSAFDARKIQITDQVIVENTGNKGWFSDGVLDCIFPKDEDAGRARSLHENGRAAEHSIAGRVTTLFRGETYRGGRARCVCRQAQA